MTKTAIDKWSVAMHVAEERIRAQIIALHLGRAQAARVLCETPQTRSGLLRVGAALDHEHGWEELAERLEKRADAERKAAASEQEQADRTRDALEREQHNRHKLAARW
jgi:hypothetical protein